MDHGDTLRFTLANASTRTLVLEDTWAEVVLTNLKTPKNAVGGGGTLYRFGCRVKIDGQPMSMIRYVPVQESFYQPYVVNGMRIWFDAVKEIGKFFNETHGECLPRKAARFAVQDASLPICSEQKLRPWYPNKANFIDVHESYNGDDVWLGPYQGADLHGGLDSAAGWRDPLQLCLDLKTDPAEVKRLVDLAMAHFQEVYDYFDGLLKAAALPSVTWMAIPSFGKMHIPSCDFAALISPAMFEEFGLPVLREEVKPMTHNVFHVDGRGVLKDLDLILSVPEIQAIQWVQGMGHDLPIMQWVPLIRRLQAAGKSVMVDLQVSELEDFIGAMRPEGLLLCLAADESLQPAIIKRVEKW